MTMLATLSVGPVSTSVYNLTFPVRAASNVKGFVPATFTGVMALAPALQLVELVSNPSARRTIGGTTGVLEFVTCTSFVVSNFNGYYLLQSFDFLPYKIGNDARFSDFSLVGLLIPASVGTP